VFRAFAVNLPQIADLDLGLNSSAAAQTFGSTVELATRR
jgi:hypothetical protein